MQIQFFSLSLYPDKVNNQSNIQSMKKEVIEILCEYDGLAIADFDIVYQGALITDVLINDNGEIVFWSGNPFTDKHAEQILVDKKTENTIYKEIIECYGE